jgi:hypothetical protein
LSGFEYRVINTSGSEIGLVRDERPELAEDDELTLPDGRVATVLEVYDDDDGREGGVAATVVVDEA